MHQSKKLLHSALALMLTAVPLSVVADENINIYGWQNWSYEFVDYDKAAGGSREYDRMSNNAANIGFMSHIDTGIEGLQVGLRCEQFTYWGRLNNYTGWCNRNSKISLRHETMGEIMFGQWLLPYNEIVAQWIDPFYDAGADSHTSIMGNIGGAASSAGGYLSSLFYNGSFSKAGDFTAAYGALAFNRRQEGVIQYVWPNTGAMADQSRDGFQFRFAVTEGSGTDTDKQIQGSNTDATDDDVYQNVDPRVVSTGVAWQKNLANGGQVWLAAAYEHHEDVSITSGLTSPVLDANGKVVKYDHDNDANTRMVDRTAEVTCGDSEDEGYRLAGRYVHDWGNGQKTMLGAMWEDLEYDADNCTNLGPNQHGDVRAVWTDVERDAWMVSGKHSFGNGFDVRFSYMDADEWDCGDDTACTDTQEDDTDAEAYNLGLFYTMPAGTEMRLTYSEVQNENNAGYDFGINAGAAGGAAGEDVEMFAIGIVHWFD